MWLSSHQRFLSRLAVSYLKTILIKLSQVSGQVFMTPVVFLKIAECVSFTLTIRSQALFSRSRVYFNLNSMAGGAGDDHIYVLPLFVSVFMRVACILVLQVPR